MKASKILGITLLTSGLTTCGAWVYNESRHEKENKMFWDQMIVEKYDTAKYNELKKAKVYDYDIWEREATRIEDSLRRVDNAKKAPHKTLKDTCDTIAKGLKKFKK